MAVWSGLAMNYGHFAPHDPYNTETVATDLALLRSLGVTKLRIASPPYDSVDMEHVKVLTDQALDLGFYVVIGTTTGTANVDLAKFIEFEDYCLEDLLPWCQSLQNANLEVHLGNEESLHTAGAGMTLEDVIARLKSLATSAQAIYTHGKISTTEVSTYISDWVSAGKGNFDYMSFNCYSVGPVSIRAQADAIVAGFGADGYISEWGTPHGYQDYNSEEIWKQITKKQVDSLIASGIADAYYFTYRDGSFGLITDGWALKTSTGGYRPVISTLCGIRPWFRGYPNTLVSRSNTPSRGNTPVRANTPSRATF